MGKRLKLTLCIFISLFIFTGCTGDNNFSEKEEAVVADYMAKIVFKHAEGYNYRLENVSNNPFIREEIDEGEPDDILDSEQKEDDSKSNTQINSDILESDNDEEDEYTLGEALGFDKNIEVKVMKSKVVDDLSKGAYYLDSSKNKKLVKLDIKITNKSDKKQTIKFNNSVIKLVIGSQKYSPLLTALDDDLQFLSSSIAKDKSITSTIVYEIDDEDAKEDKSLEVSTKDIMVTVLVN